jgi:hypothetical protein
MNKGFKIIWARVPKKAILYVIGAFGGVLADRLYDSLVLDSPFVGLPKLISVILWTFCILITYFNFAFIIFAIKIVGETNTKASSPNSLQNDVVPIIRKKEKLPYSQLSIGNLTFDILSVDILADIKLEERNQPDIQNFLIRLHLGDPYCPKCSRPLDKWNAGWQVDFAQIGYACSTCGTRAKGDSNFVLSEIHAKVRSNYDTYWKTYKNKFDELTGGHPEDFIYSWERDSSKH